MLVGILLLLPTAWMADPETDVPRRRGVTTYTLSFQPVDSLPVMISPPSSYRGRFGGQVTSVPDVDGDETPDFLVSATQAGPEDPMHEGRVYAYSGRTGRLVDTLAYPDARYPDSLSYEHSFGHRIARVGDLDGDGTDDVIVTGLNVPPLLFSGATLDPLRLLPRRFRYAAAFASLPDRTGDGIDELVVGGRSLDSVYVVDGKTEAVLQSMGHPRPDGAADFGLAVSVVGDVDGDGTADLAVGSPGDTLRQGGAAGRAFVFSTADGRLLHTFTAPTPQAEALFGHALAAPGDVTGDGTPDLVVGEPRRTKQRDPPTGQAYLLNGDDGTAIATLSSPRPKRRMGFGSSLAAVGDLDGDDVSDIFVGAGSPRGRETLDGLLFSGADGRALRVDSPLTSYGPPVSVGAAGDLNGDGTPDLFFRARSGVRIVGGDAVRAPLPPSATADERPAEVHRYPVETDEGWGYIDASGELVIAPRFEVARFFSDGWARVTLDGRPAFIDSTGSVVLRPAVSSARSFSEGLAAASPTDTPLWGYIDTTGTFAIEPQFLRAYRFSNGRAAIEKNGAFGYVNQDGEIVIAPQYENARRFGNGRAPVLVEQTMDEAWGYVNRDGTMVIEPRYTSALPFSQGCAPVNTSDDRLGGDYHYIDPAGTVAFEAPSFSFSGALVFSNGLAPVKGGFDDRWGYINRDGETVIDHEYVFAEPFHGPLARVATSYRDGIRVSYQGPLTHEVEGAEWAYLNENGEQVWP